MKKKKKWFQIEIDEEILLDILTLANNFNYKTPIDNLKIFIAKVEYNNRIYEIHIEEGQKNHTVITYLNTENGKIAIVYEAGFFTIEEEC